MQSTHRKLPAGTFGKCVLHAHAPEALVSAPSNRQQGAEEVGAFVPGHAGGGVPRRAAGQLDAPERQRGVRLSVEGGDRLAVGYEPHDAIHSVRISLSRHAPVVRQGRKTKTPETVGSGARGGRSLAGRASPASVSRPLSGYAWRYAFPPSGFDLPSYCGQGIAVPLAGQRIPAENVGRADPNLVVPAARGVCLKALDRYEYRRSFTTLTMAWRRWSLGSHPAQSGRRRTVVMCSSTKVLSL